MRLFFKIMLRYFLIITFVVLTGLLGFLMHPTVIGGFHLPDMGYLAWIYLVPLYLVLDEFEGAKLWLIAFCSAIIFYSGNLYWLVLAMKNFGGLQFFEALGVFGLVVLIQATFFALFLGSAFYLYRKLHFPFYLSSMVSLVAMEYFRTYLPANGFPWAMPTYSQGDFLKYFQWIDSTGVHGLNVLIYLVNGLITEMIQVFLYREGKDRFVNRLLVMFIVIVLSFTGSIFRQNTLENHAGLGSTLQYGLIQGNVTQDEKWDPKLAREHLSQYFALSEKAANQGASLVIWPETANPFTIDLNVSPVGSVLGRGHVSVPVLYGGMTESDKLYNSAILMDENYQFLSVYHKRHLVPFGEYVPLKNWLTFAQNLTVAVGDFSPGTSDSPVIWNDVKMGILICYEDIFSDLSRASVLQGANILVNITNDAWYGNSSALYQHLVFSQFRALENRRNLLRVTNTGITATIDERGEVIKKTNPFIQDFQVGTATLKSQLSFYTRHGDYLAQIALLVFFTLFFHHYVLKRILLFMKTRR